MDYEVLRNVILSVHGLVGWYDYKGIARTDDIWAAGMQVIWKINRNLSASLNYVHDERTSDFPGIEDFDRNVVVVGVQVRY